MMINHCCHRLLSHTEMLMVHPKTQIQLMEQRETFDRGRERLCQEDSLPVIRHRRALLLITVLEVQNFSPRRELATKIEFDHAVGDTWKVKPIIVVPDGNYRVWKRQGPVTIIRCYQASRTSERDRLV